MVAPAWDGQPEPDLPGLLPLRSGHRADSFRASREFLIGRRAERMVERLLVRRGWHIIPSYDYAGEGGDKAPRLCGQLGRFAVPDLDAARFGRRCWCEVKYKREPIAWRNGGGELRHGFAMRLFEQYQRVSSITGTDVFIFVVEWGGAVLVRPLAALGQPQVGGGWNVEPGGRAFWARAKFHILADWRHDHELADIMFGRDEEAAA